MECANSTFGMPPLNIHKQIYFEIFFYNFANSKTTLQYYIFLEVNTDTFLFPPLPQDLSMPEL